MTELGNRIIGITAILTWSCLSACGGSPEQAALDQFFRASKTADATTLARMSAVSPPIEAESWNVVEVSSRSNEPFELPELQKEFEAAEQKREEGTEKRTKYFEEHRDALEEIIPKLRDEPDYQFRGRLGEIQEEWSKLQEERAETERVYQELKRAFDFETRLATRSVVRQVPLGGFSGEVEVSEVLVNLKPKDGAELPYKATLRRYAVTDPELGRVEPARWVIVDFEGMTEEARAAAETPEEESVPVPAPEPAAEVAAKTAEAAESTASSEEEAAYRPKELRGVARVQILAPESKVQGNDVVTVIRARNASKDWITRFTATEHWYDKEGNALSNTSRTHEGRFMPGEVVEFELRTPKSDDFFQNQFLFQHSNGEVNAAVVQSFPEGK